jgi:DNA polymerase III, delta subunit
MPRISQQELLSRLEKGRVIPAVLLLGEEAYLRDKCREQLIERFVPEAARTWAVSRYSADRGETQAALDQAQTMAMLSPLQVVFLEDAEAIEKLGEKNRDEAVAQLDAYVEDPAPFTVLVVEATSLDQRMKLGKLLTEKALVVECGLGENANKRQAGSGIRKGGGGGLGGICGRGFDAAENGDRQTGHVRRGEKSDCTSGRQRAGHFREDDNSLGIGGFAGIAAAEKGAGISGPVAS